MRQFYVVAAFLTAAIIVVLYCIERKRTTTLAFLYSQTTSDIRNVVDRLTQIEGTQSAWVREFYANQSSKRVERLQSMGNATNFKILYNVIVPEVTCPYMVRVGSVVDGGKYVCNPLAIPKEKCRIYSLGLANEISFDREIQEITENRCRIHGYDAREQSADVKAAYESMGGTLDVKYINGSFGNRIEDLLNSNGDKFIDILKIDIEGSEHQVLVPFLSNQEYKVCQILIEIHGRPLKHLQLLVSVAKLNYALFSYEINGYTTIACEYCFIHLDCMERYGAVELKRYLNYVNL